MRILIVEDNQMARLMMVRSLQKWGYDTLSAENISSAITLIKEDKIQFVITDWLMPGGNGTLLCEQIRALNLPFYTYIILVTALNDPQSTVQGMEAGADDFISKPVQLDELHVRIKAGLRVLNLEKKLQEINARLSETSHKLLAANKIIERDLAMAAVMQRKLLPGKVSTVEGIAIDWLFKPSTHLSGDIFNFFPIDAHHVGFYILDVAGHGIASAMHSFTLSRILSPETRYDNPLSTDLLSVPDRRIAKVAASASAVVTHLNNQFQTDEGNILYFTIIYGVIDTQNGTIDLCQAGHPHSLYLKQGNPAVFIANSNLPVGVIPDTSYESVPLKYASGDRLFLYSDGITECEAPTGEMFGSERLRLFAEETRHLEISDVIHQLDQRIKAWHGASDFDDDISLLILAF